MSLLIRVKNADFSLAGLPQLEETINGFPADGLVGLYLFESGSNDATHPGPFVDSSGNGNHAVIHNDWSAPIKRSWGLEVTDVDGLVLNTGIPVSGEFTAIVCMRTTVARSSTQIYARHVGDTGGLPVSKTGGVVNDGRVMINSLSHEDDGLNNFGLYGGGSTTLGTSRPGNTIGGDSREASIYGYGVSASQSKLVARSLDGLVYNNTDASIAADYAGDLSANSIAVGCWPSSAPVPSTCDIYAFVVYDRLLSDDQFAAVMAAMSARVTARGISVYS